MTKELWIEKYRPKRIDEYVFRDNRLRMQAQEWIKEKTIPHLLLYGSPGTGKSSLAQVLLREIGVHDGDVLYINASDQRGIDTVREPIQNFVATWPQGDFKVVLLEEADHLTPEGQAALRRVMEDFADCARFILTCNYVNKIIPAIQSRCQTVELQRLDQDEFKMRVLEILVTENVDVSDVGVVDNYIAAAYPDLRKCINMLQQNVLQGKLLNPLDEQASSADWRLQAIELFALGKITQARKLICEQIRPEEFESFFTLCYQNLQWWGKTEAIQEQAIVIIRDALVKHALVADPEINLSAMLVQLKNLDQ